MTGVTFDIEQTFVNSLALIVKETKGDLESEYRKGWLDGYGRAWTQMTGQTIYQLIAQVNQALKGTGWEIEL